jgi:hypothetical protein
MNKRGGLVQAPSTDNNYITASATGETTQHSADLICLVVIDTTLIDLSHAQVSDINNNNNDDNNNNNMCNVPTCA